MDYLLGEGYRRIQTLSHVDRHAAHVWYARGLGMTKEGVMRRANGDGSDAVMFARVRED